VHPAGLGYKLDRAEKLLGQFVSFLEQAGAATVTVDAAVAWATQPSNGDSCWWSHRLSVVRGFARYLSTVDPAAQIPPTDLLPGRSHRATPDQGCAMLRDVGVEPSPATQGIDCSCRSR
jgi:integrase/recombinase XerD